MIVNLDPNRHFIFELPYGLTLSEVKLESDAESATLTEELQWFKQNVTTEELPRIMLAALILRQVVTPTPHFAACLRTAIIWERG